jgi:hypothetical protein
MTSAVETKRALRRARRWHWVPTLPDGRSNTYGQFRPDSGRTEVWMEAHDDELGPIEIVVIAFPAGAPMTGEACA